MADTLAAGLRSLLPTRHQVAAVATVSPAGTQTATLGAQATDDFEIGSVSKGLTGMLYADALARGQVTAGTTLGELLPLDGAPAAGVTLGALSTHTSGLPRLPPDMRALRRTLDLWRNGANPYGESVAELLDQTRSVTPGKPRPRYSNLGFELLGHGVAAAAGTTYAALLRERIAEPLGLTSCYAPATAADLGPGALTGRNRRGRPCEAWTGEAIAPAGGVRMSITDLAVLVRGLLDGTAPGTAALDPVRDFSRGVRIGAGWMVLTVRGRSVTWHNGRTGGFACWLGLDRSVGTGVALVSATAVSVDNAGFRLLGDLETAG